MTYVALAGILLIFALAVVVGIVDARTATRWRRVAAERRRAWEAGAPARRLPDGPAAAGRQALSGCPIRSRPGPAPAPSLPIMSTEARLDAIGIVVSDMAKALAFYRQLGLDVPASADGRGARRGRAARWSAADVRRRGRDPLVPPGLDARCAAGVRTSRSPFPTPRAWTRCTPSWWRPGTRASSAPFDAFWGQRYAVVLDPDGNGVDLFAPLGQLTGRRPGQRPRLPGQVRLIGVTARATATSAAGTPGPEQGGGAGGTAAPAAARPARSRTPPGSGGAPSAGCSRARRRWRRPTRRRPTPWEPPGPPGRARGAARATDRSGGAPGSRAASAASTARVRRPPRAGPAPRGRARAPARRARPAGCAAARRAHPAGTAARPARSAGPPR